MKYFVLISGITLILLLSLFSANDPTAVAGDVTITPTVSNYLPLVIKPEATPEPYVCSEDYYNCSDFNTQAEAQAAFDYCMAQGVGDIHRLDFDNDNIACESLP